MQVHVIALAVGYLRLGVPTDKRQDTLPPFGNSFAFCRSRFITEDETPGICLFFDVIQLESTHERKQ